MTKTIELTQSAFDEVANELGFEFLVRPSASTYHKATRLYIHEGKYLGNDFGWDYRENKDSKRNPLVVFKLKGCALDALRKEVEAMEEYSKSELVFTLRILANEIEEAMRE
jgi:hypothetical protein